jgi:hypothetical protein
LNTWQKEDQQDHRLDRSFKLKEENMTIFVRRQDTDPAPTAVSINLKSSLGKKSYLTIKTAAGLHLEIGGDSSEVLELLRGLVSEVLIRTVVDQLALNAGAADSQQVERFHDDGRDASSPLDPSLDGRLLYDRLKHILPDLID